MPRMSKKRKMGMSFFLNEKGRISYNQLCKRCTQECKQSFRTEIVDCPRYVSKRAVGKGGTA
ncbi:hypothetical protein CDQ80_02105 [Campylobacter hyointestinalis subsp. hyointestinalis]|uniref:hypothetical protein n=1 Tax=Campylobacter hyointestinalis TaxID=198 RepID=UPI000CE511D9|nr:hypothetical protein [Campylobacter hyointestinalis]PPB73717.1 hypothetical protein CDQ79_02120 [Campylobacter hyointestinalis subsp. hyointestinalis]PPB75318.1 hypothetical protein CDQ80_02105 [Campylobacter hyointestinalis subsp. hyointestinalis]PPB76978.1 hypothetical protein CDQ81_03915 [Campylobacter hyointestinalis subsp. hyointestinalis]PPB79071.1 hypothetical protein CDQ82_00230 [Campylobacter hyointestinalis subsp. hyointestinalis]